MSILDDNFTDLVDVAYDKNYFMGAELKADVYTDVSDKPFTITINGAVIRRDAWKDFQADLRAVKAGNKYLPKRISSIPHIISNKCICLHPEVKDILKIRNCRLVWGYNGHEIQHNDDSVFDTLCSNLCGAYGQVINEWNSWLRYNDGSEFPFDKATIFNMSEYIIKKTYEIIS